MADYTITIGITIDQHGNADFTVSPSAKRIYANDRVRWICPDGAFALQFQEATPANRMDARAARVADDRFETEFLTVRNDARGHYHYSVAVYRDGQIYMDSGCPELIAN